MGDVSCGCTDVVLPGDAYTTLLVNGVVPSLVTIASRESYGLFGCRRRRSTTRTHTAPPTATMVTTTAPTMSSVALLELLPGGDVAMLTSQGSAAASSAVQHARALQVQLTAVQFGDGVGDTVMDDVNDGEVLAGGVADGGSGVAEAEALVAGLAAVDACPPGAPEGDRDGDRDGDGAADNVVDRDEEMVSVGLAEGTNVGVADVRLTPRTMASNRRCPPFTVARWTSHAMRFVPSFSIGLATFSA